MCLFFFMWFVSGIVMMYVAFPSLTTKERLAGLPNLDPKGVLFDPSSLIQKVGSDAVASLRLTTVLARPAYLLTTRDGATHGSFADTDEPIPEIDSNRALLAATSFYRNAVSDSKSLASVVQENVLVDQWTVSSSLNRHRPLQKVVLNDQAGTHLYVSTVSGEVVRDTTKHERIWNWLGANLHWIYPVQLRRYPSVWHWVVVVLSSLGVLVVMIGGVVGAMRLRVRKRYRHRDMTPYRGVAKYHHLLGLVCFIFLFTYILSGLLSMNPFGVFDSESSCRVDKRLYSGTLKESSAIFQRDNIVKLIRDNADLKEVRFYWLADSVFPIGVSSSTRKLLSGSRDLQQRELVKSAVLNSITQCNPNVSISESSVLTEFDSYYYSHHGSERPLPVYKVELNDEDKTWVYINARTGEWIFSKTSKQRAQRWLYNGLHSLDFLFLIQRRPLWDLTVIALCLLGSVMALSSIVVAFKRLRRHAF